MFDYNRIIERAVRFFPSWSDINKRYKKSRGGLYLQSVGKEILDNMEKEIQEYIDMYFLDRYKDEDSILAFVYKTNIGDLNVKEISKIIYMDERKEITEDINEFIKNPNLIYYEDGYLYVSEYAYIGIDILTVYFNDNYLDYVIYKDHVWNIFDEFACFVGLRRHEDEKNSSLKERILYRTENLPNATEDGIKHSIISNLMDKIDIKESDIDIKPLTPKSLIKQYEEFESLLDYLSDKNRDVYKDKKWDLDLWQYDFKSIKYIPYKWDEILKEYKNGVGFDDDLNVIMSNSSTKTDAKITLYKKSEEKLTEFVHNKNINKDIKFKLKRHKNILNSKTIKYNINASPAINIKNQNINVVVYEDNYKKEKRRIDELYKIGSGILPIDRSKITDSNKYQLEFRPLEDITMRISKCNVIYKNKYTNEIMDKINLLSQAPGFMIKADGSLVNTSIKKQVKKINDLASYNNLSDTENGIEILNDGSSGKGLINVSGLGLMQVNFDTEYQLSKIPKSNLKLDAYCFFNEDGDIIMRHDVDIPKKINIKTNANIVSFDVDTESTLDVIVEDELYGFYNEKITGNKTFKTKVSDKPRNIDIKINGMAVRKRTKIMNLKYSSHEIDFSLEKGELLKTSDGQYILPSIPENNIIMKMISNSGLSPVVKRIYIGSDVDTSIYKTEIIPYRSNCDRIFEITSNCKIDLVNVNSYGAEISRTSDYEPTNAYKSNSNGSWIRLNTSEYSSIESITAPIGKIEVIEESGVLYYNLVLNNGDVASNVIIEGKRNYEAKRISLEDIIKTYVPNFETERDNIYCSLLSDGLIIQQGGLYPRVFELRISSKIFSEISASKYIVEKPKDINVLFSYGNQKKYDYEHEGEFDYISFYPANAQVHTCLNEFNIYANESRNIKTLNNFNPSINEFDLYFYTVEPYSILDEKIDIRFCDASDDMIPFEDLLPYSIGKKDVAIKSNIDLSNSISYEIQTYDIIENMPLSKYIPIKKEYKIDNNFTIYTNRYVVEPSGDMTVEYKTYDGTEENSHMIKSEQIIVEEDGFNKLEYSNIDKIQYLSFNPYSNKNEILIDNFTLLKDEGIIVWTDQDLIKSGAKLFIRYTIKEPIALVYSTDELYKAIDYTIDAYDELEKHTIKNMKENDKYDLKNISAFNESDLVHVICLDPSFEAILDSNMLRFKKFAEENTVLIKTGFYYINGKEYYLFSNNESKELENKNYMESHNIEKAGGELYLHKETNNYIRNSEMLLRGMNSLYNFDCSKKTTYGISDFNNLTACESYNMWETFEMKVSIVQGLNDSCLSFNERIDGGYAFIEITEFLSNKSLISFWADSTLSVFIGSEDKMETEFKDSLNIETEFEIMYESEDIREAIITKNDERRYYIVVTGNGRLDDIIIKEAGVKISHDKNIDQLGLSIKENKTSGTIFRIEPKGNKYSINNKAAFDKDGKIRIAPNINWGITKIKEYSNKADFSNCTLSNVIVHNNYISTTNSEGQFETDVIYLDNPLTIKRLFYKVNEVDFEEMNNMKVTIYSSNSKSGPFIPVMYLNENTGFAYGDYLNKYIKLKVDIPAKKILNNLSLFAEYRSDKINAPKVTFPNYGELITKVYDAQENLDFRIKKINIEEINDIYSVTIKIRASRDKYTADVWMDWKEIKLDENLNIKNIIEFKNSRFFQIKISIRGKDSYLKLKSIDLEVI